MRKMVIAITFLAIVFSLSLGQKTQTTTKRKTVTAANIASLPSGKSYEIDLRNKGTVYEFKDSATDFSRVSVRTATGVKTMAELVEQSKTDTKGGLTIGMPADLRGLKMSTSRIGGGGLNFNCSGLFCECTGDTDCNNMFSGSACSSFAWCNLNTGKCYCVARA